jgi:GNAT superfamily N-acetyltransferase
VSGTAAVALRAPEPRDVDAMLAVVTACDETWREWAPEDWEPPAPGSAQWVSQLGASDRWTRVAIAPGHQLVGLVSWGPAREGPEWALVPGMAHLGALFVDPQHWRRGIAATLLGAATDAMRAAGYAHAQLNTPVGAPAERFYAAQGWSRDGRTRWHEAVRLPSVGYHVAL